MSCGKPYGLQRTHLMKVQIVDRLIYIWVVYIYFHIFHMFNPECSIFMYYREKEHAVTKCPLTLDKVQGNLDWQRFVYNHPRQLCISPSLQGRQGAGYSLLLALWPYWWNGRFSESYQQFSISSLNKESKTSRSNWLDFCKGGECWKWYVSTWRGWQWNWVPWSKNDLNQGANYVFGKKTFLCAAEKQRL